MENLLSLSILNKEQRAAAETVYGSVLVVAGAGTGKTQLIASRTANMLVSDAGITPNMILLLTFTNAGVVAMRKRLLKVIGTDAYKLAIHTFHSFCNEVIQGNPDYFGLREHEPVSDLERLQIVAEIIRELPPDNPLKRLTGDVYYESRRMLNLFSFMKEENYTQDDFLQVTMAETQAIIKVCNEIKEFQEQVEKELVTKDEVKAFIQLLGEDDKYVYKRAATKQKVKAGYLKKHVLKADLDRLFKLQAAANCLEAYNDKMNIIQRYDFSDMIHYVLKAFQTDDYFLLNMQERYQFVVVDEFNDTNRSQLGLVNLLMSFWDDPNIFCVGDSDQCIFEFNGARIKNMLDFQKMYNAKTVVLDKNYRSSQVILDHATSLINNNNERLVTQIPGLSKSMTAELVKANNQPVCHSFVNPYAETAWVKSEIDRLASEGEDLSDVAVIYRKHKLADDLIQQFEASGIDYNIYRSINVLDTVHVRQIINMLVFVMSMNESNMVKKEHLFFEILHYKCFGNDIQKIHNYYIQLNDKDFRSRKPKDIVDTEKIFSDIILEYHNIPLVNIIFELVNRTGLLEFILKRDDSIQILQYINTFFSWVKGEAFKNPALNGKGLVDMIDKMRENNLFLSATDLHSFNTGVNLLTAHGAKGLEFKHVYMIACNRNEWEATRSGNQDYKLPKTLTMSGDENKLESGRRLFYVAQTRAKEYLNISFSEASITGTVLEPSQFIEESKLFPVPGPEIDAKAYLANALKDVPYRLEVLKSIIDKRLESFRLSVSAMNKYLECGLSFYYENIVRVPFVAHPALIYGNASHTALKKLYDSVKAKKTLSWSEFFQVFSDYMKRNLAQMTKYDYDLRMELGDRTLKYFYNEVFPSSNKITLNEFKFNHVVVDGVPCTGDIDKLEFEMISKINYVDIDDYKTGKLQGAKDNLRPPTEKNPLGGEYWRQGVFYVLLVKNFPGKDWVFRSCRFDVLGDGRSDSLPVKIDEAGEKLVKDLMKQAYEGIKAHKFDGCGKEECKWCSL